MKTDVGVRHARAWLALALSLAVHVVDEATHDFLSVYNPTVIAIRSRVSWLPLPTFTFTAWLTGLCLAVLALLALTPAVYRGSRALTLLSLPFGILMLANGLAHIIVSIGRGGPMPGVLSAPLLLIASVWLLAAAHERWKQLGGWHGWQG